jgi:putative two-component system response regulator
MEPEILEKEITLRKQYTELTEEDVILLTEVRPIVEAHLYELVEAFYSHLLQFEETRKILKDEDTVNRLKEAQGRYLTSLFSGDYGPRYVEDRMRIGEVHYKIGVEIRWYLGAVHHYEWLLAELIRRHGKMDTDKYFKVQRAICTILYLDTQWVLEAYEMAYSKELRRRLEELQIDSQAFESLNECIILTDLERKIIKVNPACVQITGYEQEELVGQSPKLLSSGETPHYVFTEIGMDLIKKGRWAGEVVNRRKDGTLWNCYLSIRQFKDLEGVPRGYIGLMRDITGEKKIVALLERQARDQENLYKRMRGQFEETAYMFATACEAKDETTGNHVRRIREYTTAIARELGLSEDMAEEIGISSILHDVGKMHVPDSILMKPGTLTLVEREVMKKHTLAGERILHSESFQMARNIALNHHENWDGTGYPKGLKGAEIPIEARITKVADVFDALTSERPYKRAWSEEKALNEIRSSKGKEFCPTVVEAFERAYQKWVISEIRRRLEDRG